MSVALGLELEAAERWVAFWVGAHDIGKVCPGFQAKDPSAKESLKRFGFRFPATSTSPAHGIVTTSVLRRALVEPSYWPAVPRDLANRVAIAVGGHHGVFPRAEQTTGLSGNELGNDVWSRARHDLLATLAEALHLPGQPVPRTPPDDDHAFFMLLAGLTSVADWVGSAQDFFPFAGGGVDLAVYPSLAAERARTALKKLGWTCWRGKTNPATFQQLFVFQPRPLQEKAVGLAASFSGPGMVIIEAPMGEGKTEAALFLSDYWNSVLSQSGLYVALPTQATSNQMFSRVRDFLAKRYPAESVNLHLLHGHSLLSDDYQQLRLAAIYDEPSPQGAPGRVVAEGWFTPKKRGLLAPFAVGTIDQVLLAVLQTRHFFVRLFGLANKTVLLDEVHAYDAYMSTLLERLVAWLAALGCSVVLLSATLPRARRQRLLAAFGVPEKGIPEARYPRLLSVRDGMATAASYPAARSMSIALDWVDASAVAGRLKEALRGGGCAAVICNTVGRAQEMYEALRIALEPENIPVNLFHARFPFGQRDVLEKAVLRCFGKEGERPHRAVLVATQVIEQSLDLDFDLLVTELSPVDLLLQRAGRLHRHPDRLRPASLAEAHLWLVGPDEVDEQGVAHFGKSEYVYDRHILLRSYLALAEYPRLRLPDDLETLVEMVYGDQPLTVPSPAWQAALDESEKAMEAKRTNDRQTAQRFLIKPPDYEDDLLEDFCQELEEDNPQVHSILQALTRLGDPTVNVVCLYRTDGPLSLQPDGGGTVDLDREPTFPETKRLLAASLSLSHPALVKHFLAQEAPRGWQKISLLRHHRVADFDAGHALQAGPYTLRLDRVLGAVIEKSGATQP